MSQLRPELLLQAYAIGVFPMAESHDDARTFFVDPEERGVLPLNTFHVSRSLRKEVKRRRFDIRCDTDFKAVLEGCAEPRDERPDTWINDEIFRLYMSLHEMGYGHSVECWHDGKLVGGLYGVALGAAFFGESMFSREPNASKVALVHLVARLKASGFTLLDSQFITDHLAQFGAVEIPRQNYRDQLAEAIKIPAEFYSESDDWPFVEELLQSRSQTS
ncbi:leucyl/phenylalanyl-tRNA--protein transferase [Nisaea denitrificans]|uniref:leucyl/phenylalanyl-tRNA--protein transferase n=1 Tax=Nisaea denitrificans TaxID=390877 RepID=UPI00041EBF77|nr:leucyl/phenylalanyl-tRNA--protein transferase [Nisaea denitrificans]